MKGARVFLVGTLWLLACAGCATPKSKEDFTPVQARLFLESTDHGALSVKLPRSGVSVAVSTRAVITEGDIVNAEVAQVEMGRCLLLQVTPAAARDLFRLTASNQGRRLVLTLNDVALGARQITAPFAEGAVLIFVEIDDAALDTLVKNLKATAVILQREIARK